jgi:hypothetical protein
MVYPNLLVNGMIRSLIRIRINNYGFGPESRRPKNKGAGFGTMLTLVSCIFQSILIIG